MINLTEFSIKYMQRFTSGDLPQSIVYKAYNYRNDGTPYDFFLIYFI